MSEGFDRCLEEWYLVGDAVDVVSSPVLGPQHSQRDAVQLPIRITMCDGPPCERL